jgi:hypothetical protein
LTGNVLTARNNKYVPRGHTRTVSTHQTQQYYYKHQLHAIKGTVSDNVTDVVMSSLRTCNLNYGSCWEGRGRVGSKGWAVDHQPRTSVDGHSHHDHQEGDFQVSKKGWFITQKNGKAGTKGSKGELANKAI